VRYGLRPTAATQVDHWQIDRLNGQTGTRFLRGTQRGDIGAEVAIVGAQVGDGTVTERLILVRHGDDVIAFHNAAAALETARNLLAAAGELAQLQQLG
jgi:Ca2+-binding RTX toxin-like protein